MTTKSSSRLAELDVLRGLAALAVVMFHYTTRYDSMFGHPEALPFQFPLGHLGVELFFMISGFVIFLTLNRTTHYKDFLVSRFSRLFPVYWVAVLTTFSVVTLLGLPGEERSLSELLVNFSMIQEFFGVKEVDSVYWTLRYELIFYCIMLAIFLSGKIGKIETICAIWLGIQLFSILYEHYSGYFPWKIKQFLLLEYSNLFVAGCLFNRAFVSGFNKERAGLLLVALITHFLAHDLVESLVVTGFFGLFGLFCLNKLRFLCIRPLIYLGTISYSLYLIHQNISYALFRQLYELGVPQIVIFSICFAIALGLAHILTFAVERPAMQWIRRRYRNSQHA